MNHAFGQAKQKALQPVQQLALAGGYTAGQGIKTFDQKVGPTALRRGRNEKRLGKYKQNLNTLSDPKKAEKERKKAEKATQRFEKRLAKNEKKQENPHLSKKKQEKLEQEKKINAPALDSKKKNPLTPEGQELKQLQDKAKLSKDVRMRAEHFKKNTQSVYEDAQQRSTQEELDKKVMDKTKTRLQEEDAKKEVVSRFVANRQAQIREKEANKRKETQRKKERQRFKDKSQSSSYTPSHPFTQAPEPNPFEER
jgi:hypothetical protein